MSVSVIIPVYNAARYLDAALRSVFVQKGVGLEVIAVDDGSTDSSLAILNRWALEHSDMTVVHQQNCGQGAARNRGMERATGEYIYFMDADDELSDASALSALTRQMDARDLDMIFFDAETAYDEGCKNAFGQDLARKYIRRHDYLFVRSGWDLFVTMYQRGEYTESPCLFVSRRSFVERTRLRFREGMFFEDSIYTLGLLLKAERVAHMQKIFYRRHVHASTTMTGVPTARHLRGRMACYHFGKELCRIGNLDRHLSPVVRDLTWRYKRLARITADGMQARNGDWPGLDEVRHITWRERIGSVLRCLHDEGVVYTLRRLAIGRGKVT